MNADRELMLDIEYVFVETRFCFCLACCVLRTQQQLLLLYFLFLIASSFFTWTTVTCSGVTLPYTVAADSDSVWLISSCRQYFFETGLPPTVCLCCKTVTVAVLAWSINAKSHLIRLNSTRLCLLSRNCSVGAETVSWFNATPLLNYSWSSMPRMLELLYTRQSSDGLVKIGLLKVHVHLISGSWH